MQVVKMKKVLLTALVLIVGTFAYSQEYKANKVLVQGFPITKVDGTISITKSVCVVALIVDGKERKQTLTIKGDKEVVSGVDGFRIMATSTTGMARISVVKPFPKKKDITITLEEKDSFTNQVTTTVFLVESI
jgi:hypothetical protein